MKKNKTSHDPLNQSVLNLRAIQKIFCSLLQIPSFTELCHLTERQKTILILVLIECLTYEEIGKKYKLSRERVRQIYTIGLNRVEQWLAAAATELAANRQARQDNVRLRRLNDEYSNLLFKSSEQVPEGNALLLNTRLESLSLSTRLTNSLTAGDIRTLGELAACEKRQLMRLRNFGKICMAEVEELLSLNGLPFGYQPGNSGLRGK